MKTPASDPHSLSGHVMFLRRRYPLRLRLARGVIGAVPLADLVLLVILFIILNSWIILRPGITLELPQAEFGDGVRVGRAVVALERGGLVFFDDERVEIEDLPRHFRRAIASGDEQTLVIQADRRIPHQRLVEVYDAAQSAGFLEVLLATDVSDTHRGPQ